LGSHRTTARALLFLLFLGVFAGSAQAASVPDLTAFPVVGNVSYIDDFGAPRPQGPHEGNDIMSRRHQPAVAFEGGTVEKHVGSSLGTCMLYLYARSGMTYVYIHLNNDLTRSNDNDGGCRDGVSWAPGLRNGDRVRRGELVGYVGDSGDADGGSPHLHFEIRTPSGRAIDPYTYLNKAKRLLYPRPASLDAVSLALRHSKVLAVGDGAVRIRTARIRVAPKDWRYPFSRRVVLTVAVDAIVERKTSDDPVATTLTEAAVGKIARVWTEAFTPTWTTQLAHRGTLTVRRILLAADA
jgi:hypothetical protein